MSALGLPLGGEYCTALEGFVFAQVLLDDGEWARCWFERDRPAPASDLDGVLGATPEGAMF